MQYQNDSFRLSPQQLRVWDLQQESPAYRAQCALLLEGNLRHDVIKDALQKIIGRHEIFRTAFHYIPGFKAPVQSIDEGNVPDWRVIDLTQHPAEQQQALIDEHFTRESRRQFDLEESPMLSVLLLILSTHKHVLLIGLPSLCADTWTLRNLARELSQSYATCLEGQAVLDETMRYVDFSEWQNELLEDDDAEIGKAYWLKQDFFSAPALTLPTQARSTGRKSFEPDSLLFSLSNQDVARIDVLVRNYDTAISTFLLACWQSLFWRLTGEGDIVVGNTSGGRKIPDFYESMGLYAKCLPVRSRFDRNVRFHRILQQLQENLRDAEDSEEYFTWAQNEAGRESTDYFPICFEYDEGAAAYAGNGVRFTLARQFAYIDRFQLKLSCTRNPGSISIELHYDQATYSKADVERLASQFRTLVHSAAENPEAHVTRLEMLTAEERRQILVEWNETATRYGLPCCFHQRFAAQVERTPAALAVVCEQERLSYRELNERANQLAHYLQRQGIGPESLVGVLMERSVELVVALLAVLKAGAAYVPLDPGYPAERLSFMIEDARVRLLLTAQDLDERVRVAAEVPVLKVANARAQFAAESSEEVQSDVGAENLAYVIYTSGSTGTPKGAMITHGGLLNYLQWASEAYQVGAAEQGAPLHSPLSFDLTVTSLFGPLLVGQSVVLLKAGETLSELAGTLRGPSRFAMVKVTPAHLEVLAELLGTELGVGQAAAQVLVIGGEALRSAALPYWRERQPQLRLINEYGPTETVVGCCVYEVGAETGTAEAVPIGKPIANTELYILDPEGEPVPVGVSGELHIGGVGLARGYLRRPELTAERFIPHPYSGAAGARLYRTGDIARYLEDGNIEYLGRADTQVKVRGYRIELGEIEAVLGKQAGVRQSAVLVRADGAGEKQLVAYVVATAAAKLEVSELRHALKEQLPDYMIPAAFVLLDELPLTDNGKIDRRKLAGPEYSGSRSQISFTAPRTLVEEVLANIWSQVLRIEQVGIHDNFFFLGGDSIRSVRVVALAKESGLVFTVQDLFKYQTVAELATLVEIARGGPVELQRTKPFDLISSADRRELPDDVEDAYPLAMLQMGMIYHMEMDKESPAYHNVNSFRLRFQFDAELFQQTVQRVVARHANLRTSFHLTTYSEPLQLVHKEVWLPVQFIDLRQLSPEDQEQTVSNFLAEENERLFDLTTAPLLRFHLHRLNDDTCQFTLTEPHAISDGWSTMSMLAEIFRIYFALLDNIDPPIESPPAATYRDFVHLERLTLESEECLKYWSTQLSGYTRASLPRLPLSLRTNRGARMHKHTSVIPQELFEGMRQVARTVGVPLKSVMLAAHLKMMSIICGQTDVMTGVVCNGRPEESGGEEVRGLFLNTLPLRAKVDGSSWVDLVRQVFKAELEMLPFRRYPMAELQRKWGREPLYDSTFTYLHFHSVEDVAASARLEVIEGGQDLSTTNFPLVVSFYQRPSKTNPLLTLYSEYNSDELTDEQVEAIHGYLLRILQAIVADPHSHHESQNFLSQEEQQRLPEWNATEADYDATRCVHELVAAQAQRTPAAIAVVHEEERLSYRQLNERANQLAHYLQRQGIGPESLVSILMERSADLVVALLAVLKAGAAYVPLDPSYPAERLSFLIEDAAVRLLLTQQALKEEVRVADAVQVLDVVSQREQIAAESSDEVKSEVGPDNLAYVIYTSGSSGTPKGVMISHRSLLNLVFWHQSFHLLTAAERGTLVASPAFDASVWETWPYLAAGAALYLPPEETRVLPAKLRDWLIEHGITASFMPTPLAERVLAEPWPAEGVALRSLLTGGDRLRDYPPPDLGFTVTNHYGPTESTVVTSCMRLDDCKAAVGEGGPLIGRAISNTEVYILNSELQQAPVGVRGELFIGGLGLARGYWQRPELTALQFIPHPFSREAGWRLYRSGDLARYLPDGNIEYLGRADTQVKVRGYRIELGEIEVVLARHAGVSQCAVLVREDGVAEKQLVAYVAAAAGAQVAVSELRSHLQQQLPEYMVPAVFIFVDELPLTTNGKLDRRALLTMGAAYPTPECSYLAPRTAVEEILAHLWSQVLEVDQVGIESNFFELGGHSLLAMQVISRVREVLQVELPLRDLFEAPTVAGLALLVEETLRARNRVEAPPLRVVSRTEALPLSFAQQRLWFLDQLEPHSSFYNLPEGIRLRGPLDVEALERSLATIINRHESLRTTFALIGGEPVQEIHAASEFRLPLLDLSGLPESEREAEAQRLAREEASAPFDLAVGPLLRARLFRLREEEHVVLLTLHHIISDGWSMGVLIKEVVQLYSAFSSREESAIAALPSLPIQYADYAVWQREWLSGEVLERQLSYWRKQLQGAAPVLELPTDKPRPAVQSFNGASQTLKLDAQSSAALKELSREEGVTLFMTLLAAFAVLLSRYSGQEDISIGTPVAGRTQVETEGLIGFFVNTLVLRTEVRGEESFRGLLKRVREVALGAYSHQEVPFEKLVEELQPQRELSRSPLFQVMLVFQNAAKQEFKLSGVELSSIGTGNTAAKFDLTLSLLDGREGLFGALEYNSDLFNAATMQRMVGCYEQLLKNAVAGADQAVSKLRLLPEGEREQVLDIWNQTRREYELAGSSLHELIEAQVERTPAALAVVYEREQLSYRELNARANQLAHYLQKQGIGPESLVGVLMERSVELVVALLAVLKAGAAYVPLDPAYPRERLSFMLEETGTRVLLTQQALVDQLFAPHAQSLCLDTEWTRIAGEAQQNPQSGVRGENLAYVIYTSGSTGRPKAVMNSHRGIVNRLLWMQEQYQLTGDDRVLQKTPYSFDVSVWEFFWPLLAGAAVVVARPEGHRDRDYLVELIAAAQVTVLHFVPSMLEAFLEAAEVEEGCGSVRQVICSGEELKAELARRCLERLGGELDNLYGPTEAAVDVTAWRCERGRVEGAVAIGKPIANIELYILDREGEPVPVGVSGELHIGGVGLARGYWQRPELTAERFIPNAFSETAGGRLYRTGDLARYRADGNIEYLGRADTQVKVRGYRIELGEIEAVLGRQASIKQCAVIVRADGAEKQLVAYVVADEAESLEIGELRRALKEQLPDYMIPGAFVLLDELPLTANGKLDRRALMNAGGVIAKPEVAYVAPQSEIEKNITAVWQEVLQVEKVGIDDNFFDLGGHSLLMIQVHSKLQAILSKPLTVIELFQYPTINALAAFVGARQEREAPLLNRQERAETRRVASRRQRETRSKRQDQLAAQAMLQEVGHE